MARKGSRKVRTGCLTCKARKVKCDEAKPYCNRCLNTGRKCDGYAPKPTPTLLWHRPVKRFQSVDSANEARALQFFCEQTAPSLSGTADPYFWTHLVMQFSNFEPAVRHCVVAISSLYEQFQSKAVAHSGVQLNDNSLALQHYNAAIRELKLTDNQPLVLLVCILFICIEFLQSNKEAAIQHYKHGVTLLKRVHYSWAREHLVPVFRRLSVFPYFFGGGNADFPDLISLDDPLPADFNTFAEAHSAMDGILSRTIQLVRWGDPYRIGSLRYHRVPSEKLAEHREIISLLEEWQILFKRLDARSTTTVRDNCNVGNDVIGAMSRAILSSGYEMCHIWLDIAFEADDMCFDWHIPAFRRVLDSCLILDSAIPVTKHNPRFIFETGFLPLLHGVATKCRDLNLRLEALRLIKLLGGCRENLWEADQMYALSRRVIEMEHDVVLDEQGQPATPATHPGLPPDERRVRYMVIDPKTSTSFGPDGRETHGWTVGFIIRDPEDAICVHTEFIPTSPCSWTV
ncbi:hypothetical protein GGR54DRAFT_437874 [Hypoxylon sp. NC1633]|nr:hypothetical protein GGR54DRAFT_437874 [Hypoxylon sp. NC1633]